MTERSLIPNITVTIGHHTRIYFAFVTTAPAELDSLRLHTRQQRVFGSDGLRLEIAQLTQRAASVAPRGRPRKLRLDRTIEK